jgi:hypothetical protein
VGGRVRPDQIIYPLQAQDSFRVAWIEKDRASVDACRHYLPFK